MSLAELKTKWRWSASYTLKTLLEVLQDVGNHYFSVYPLLIILGGWRRLRRRLRSIWLPRSRGRPPVDEIIVDLILEMKRENEGWGGQRISDELRLLGTKVSKNTVLRILRENGFSPPKKKFSPPSWRNVFDSYRRLWGMDFAVVFDFKGEQLYVLNIIDWCTRQLDISTVTGSPTKTWLTQQIRNAAIETADDLTGEMVRDNDAIYGKWLDKTLRQEFHIDPIPILPRCP